MDPDMLKMITTVGPYPLLVFAVYKLWSYLTGTITKFITDAAATAAQNQKDMIGALSNASHATEGQNVVSASVVERLNNLTLALQANTQKIDGILGNKRADP